MPSALDNYALAFAGKFPNGQSAAEETALELGAKVVNKLDGAKEKNYLKGHTFYLIVGPEVNQKSKKFKNAEKNGFTLLKETWLTACHEKQEAIPVDEYLWRSDSNPPEGNEEAGSSRVKPSKNVISSQGEDSTVPTEVHVGEENRDGNGADTGARESNPERQQDNSGGENDKDQRSQGRNEDAVVASDQSTGTTESQSTHPVSGSDSDKSNPKASDVDVREQNSEHEQDNARSDKDQRSQGQAKDSAIPGQESTKSAKLPSSSSAFGSDADPNKGIPKTSDGTKSSNGGSRLDGFYLGTPPLKESEPGWDTIELPEDPDTSSKTSGDSVEGRILCRIHYYFLVLLPGKGKDPDWHRGVLVLASQYSKEAGRFERNGGTTLYPKSAEFLGKVKRCTDMITGVVASNVQKTRSYIIAAKPKSREFQAFTKTTYNTRWGNRCGDHTINAARKMAGQKPLKRVQKVREDRIPGRYLRAMGGMEDDSEEDLDSEDD